MTHRGARRSSAAGLVATAALVGGAALAPNAGAGVFPGDDGMVVFDRDDHIYTVANVGGSTVERKLTTAGVNRTPSWSPNGNRIAFATKHGAIKTMGVNGTGVRRVLAKGGWQPTWHRQGGQLRLAYVGVVDHPNTGRNGEIYSIPANGGTPQRLTYTGVRQCGNSWPAFSANGRWFAYVQALRRAGRCTAEYRVVLNDRRTGNTRYIARIDVSDLDDGTATTQVAGTRLDFTSDSASLVMPTRGTQCYDVFAQINVWNGRSTLHTNFACESSGSRISLVPTPGGAWASVLSGGGDPYDFLSSPTVRATSERGFGHIDVRPRP